jgi:(S)-2-hydroxyglutarate dehydrogenase
VEAADFVVVGGGVVGLALALEARRRHPDCSVLLLEKEPRPGLHASGRNSGVLHAGFYYAADSLKARLTRVGRERLEAFCDDRGVPVHRCGKLVVARTEAELPALDELTHRGAVNGVRLEVVDEDDARRIEPRARTVGRALWSPDTAAVDPAQVVAALAAAAAEAGVRVRTGVRVLGRADGAKRDAASAGTAVTAGDAGDAGVAGVAGTAAAAGGAATVLRTSAGPIAAGYVINAAGLYADRIAHDFGFGLRYRILPFKGVYLYARPDAPRLRTHVYPVPRLENPWLGVHFTVTAAGRTKIGPTAIPAFWREHYGGLSGFRAGELADILRREAGLFLRNDFGFRAIAAEELPKYFRRNLVRRASSLVPDIHAGDYREWGTPGIRAQLLDVEERRLEMDFRMEGDDRSFHVLNAVSPAFTCCLTFAELAFDEVERLG